MDAKRCRLAADGSDSADTGDGQVEVLVVEKQQDWLRQLVQLGLFGKVWPEERVFVAPRVCKWMQRDALALFDTVRLVALPSPCVRVNAVQVGWTLMNLRKHSVALICHCPLAAISVLDGLAGAATMGFGSRLVELNFSGANLQPIGAQTAANAIRGHCRALTHVDLRGNNIQDVGLHLWAAVLSENPRLQNLVLSDNGLSAVGLRSVATGMHGARELRHLDVSRNEQIGDEGTISVASLLNSSAAHLTSLNLSCTKLAEATAALGDALGKCAMLSHLNLGQNTLCSVGMERLAAGLRHCQFFYSLVLGPNALGAEGTHLSKILMHAPALTHLSLCENRGAVTGALSCFQALAGCTALRSLLLSGDGIVGPAISALADGVVSCSSLQRLALVGVAELGPGARRVAEVVGRCWALARLELSGVREDAAVCSLAAALRLLRGGESLRSLELTRGRIALAGAYQLAAVLGGCTGLDTLSLAENELGAAGVEALAQCLAHCSALRRLDLSRNKLGPEGARKLRKGLRGCGAVEEVALAGNRFGEEGAEVLAGAFLQCTHLRRLDLSWNDLGMKGKARMKKAFLEDNRTAVVLNLENN